jgi:nucleotide-binding universal stress UspA family protein
MSVQHVLVPMDFSATAEHALAYAIALAQQLRAQLTLVHVFHLTPLVMEDAATAMPPTLLDDLETEAHRILQASLAQVQRVGLQGASLLVEGSPAQAIVETAGTQAVELIIMGAHGRTGLTHLLLGSVAEQVLRQAPCPVLVTRKTQGMPAGADDAPRDRR